MRNLRLIIGDNCPIEQVVTALQDMGYSIKMPGESEEENINPTLTAVKTVIVRDPEVLYFSREVNPDPFFYKDTSLEELFEMRDAYLKSKADGF